MKVLDLFSGIGGFSLGLEKAGMETIAFCEYDEFCQKVLKKNWPKVPTYKDVRELDGKQFRGTVDVVCGGFPCQDLSIAGHQKGIDGERSGLWSEMYRIISEIRPQYAIIENVTALLSGERGSWFSKLLIDLAKIGYDVEWHCIRASSFGFQHQRDRVWIIAYPRQIRSTSCATLLHRKSIETSIQGIPRLSLSLLDSKQLHTQGNLRDIRKDDGISNYAHRIGSLGNAIVPQIATMIGKAIMERQ